jgi:hypothetical protein
VIFRSRDSGNYHTIFKFVGEILPIQPTIQNQKTICTPLFLMLFLSDDNNFQKSARVVRCGISIESVPREPILKNVLIFEKKGMLMLS